MVAHLEGYLDGRDRRQSNADRVGHLYTDINSDRYGESLLIHNAYRYRMGYHPARILLDGPMHIALQKYDGLHPILSRLIGQ
jgi:hypothetical protein